MSQIPPPPPVPSGPPPVQGQYGVYQQPMQRGPIGGPPAPYPPESFATLYMWWAILMGAGTVLCIVIIGIPALIAAIVLKCMLMYKSWNQIQDGYQRTSPGKAVGFMFIPFFGLYWQFEAIWGLSKDLNAYMRRYGIQCQPVNEQLALTYCILVCCCIIPYLGILIAIGALVIDFILQNQIKVASMAVAQAKLNASQQAR